MASRRVPLSPNEISLQSPNNNDPLRDLFEACRNGDVTKVKKLVTPQNVNARDTAGRKSSPLHFAAGKLPIPKVTIFANWVNFSHLKEISG